MAERMPFGQRYYFPHMKPNDEAIWRRFIEQFPDVYDSVEYDVFVGTVPEFAREAIGPNGGTGEALYRKKIDVVAFKDDQIDIIELKPRAGFGAIGQVTGYRELYIKEYAPKESVKAVIITDSTVEDVGVVAQRVGVTIVVV